MKSFGGRPLPYIGRSCLGGVALVLALTAASARAETPDERRAREEVDRALASMVKIPAPRLSVWLHPVDDPNLTLSELVVRLDGRRLEVKRPEGDLWDPVRIWEGEIAPGRHEVAIRIGYRGLASYGRTYHFVLAGAARIGAERGLAVDVHPRVRIDEKAKRFKDRFHLEIGAEPTMIAEVDTSIPEPPPPFVPPAGIAEAADAGTTAPKRDGGEENDTALAAAPASREGAHARRRTRRHRLSRDEGRTRGAAPVAEVAAEADDDAPPLEPIVREDAPASPVERVAVRTTAAPAAPQADARARHPVTVERDGPLRRWAWLLAVFGALAVVAALGLLLRPR